MVRQPVVAGRFYPADPRELTTQVDAYLEAERDPEAARGIVVPHAGYMYSGAVAGEVFATTVIPRRVVMLGPNHTGAGPEIAVSGADAWNTPLGPVPLAVDLRDRLLRQVTGAQMDDRAHQQEHSLEVMLPFLQRLQSDLEIVPIALKSLSLVDCLRLGTEIGAVLEKQSEDVLLLASTDMNHFSPAATNEQLDRMAIAAMTAYDPEALYRVVAAEHISMCGVCATVAVLQAARRNGAEHCRLIRYSHSGKVSGDNRSVVGYAGLNIQ